jgi:hypothetical protein
VIGPHRKKSESKSERAASRDESAEASRSVPRPRRPAAPPGGQPSAGEPSASQHSASENNAGHQNGTGPVEQAGA